MSATGMTGSGYPIAAVQAACRLRAAGETLGQIADFIGEQYGTRPCTKTISVWTSRRVADRVRKRRLRASREHSAKGGFTGGRLGRKTHSPEFRLARMVALRRSGMTDTGIAAVMSFDYDQNFTVMQVAALLGSDIRRTWKGRARTMLLAAPDLSNAEVARRVGVSTSSVSKFRSREGL